MEQLTDYIKQWTSSNTLKQKRLEANLTQEQISKKLKIHRCHYSRWENGVTPQEHNQMKIAKILGCKRREIWK
jgi:transcriptional regulator with XRE-family HTH domain